MVDLNTVCCMCGDIGFPDKLFRCSRCFSRFQHSYCSSYYEEDSSEAGGGFCDWCRSEERKGSRKHQGGAHARKSPAGALDQAAVTPANQPENPAGGERARLQSGGGDREDSGSGRGKNTGGAGPSSRPSGRRYKLLKDVLC